MTKFAFIVIICYNSYMQKKKAKKIQKKVVLLEMAVIIYILVFIVFSLVAFAIMQIKLAGMNVKDFWTFIKANEILDDLYIYTRRSGELTAQEQVIFLMEAEKVFNAFDKVPDLLWEEEYQKYREVLNKYKDIKVLRWASN